MSMAVWGGGGGGGENKIFLSRQMNVVNGLFDIDARSNEDVNFHNWLQTLSALLGCCGVQ